MDELVEDVTIMTTNDLLPDALDWFVANFKNKQHASLQILSADAEGETSMLKVHAKDDAQMLGNCRKFLSEQRACCFVGFGEGSTYAENRRDLIPILIKYWQDAGDPFVRRAMAPYRWDSDGDLVADRWEELPPVRESWILR